MDKDYKLQGLLPEQWDDSKSTMVSTQKGLRNLWPSILFVSLLHLKCSLHVKEVLAS